MERIQEPFWELIRNRKWSTVHNWAAIDSDMKRAIFLRNNDLSDPSWYATRAFVRTLQALVEEMSPSSTVAHSTNVEELLTKLFDESFIDASEKAEISHYFDVGAVYGPRSHESLTLDEVNWLIDNAVFWTKTLISRIR